jgi:signal peptidase I
VPSGGEPGSRVGRHYNDVAMRLNLSDQPVTAELLAEGLRRTGSALIAVNGASMHPTLQMGWRIYLRPATGDDLKPGEIAVFRTEHHLTVHRLVWIEESPAGKTLVFRGDFNRVRERVPASAVLARVVAVEVPGARRGMEKVVALEGDALSLFYGTCWAVRRLLRPILPVPAPPGTPPGPFGRAARALLAGTERLLSFFLPGRR